MIVCVPPSGPLGFRDARVGGVEEVEPAVSFESGGDIFRFASAIRLTLKT
jgi:hypothetical protein